MVAKRAIAGAVPAGAGKRGYDAAGPHFAAWLAPPRRSARVLPPELVDVAAQALEALPDQGGPVGKARRARCRGRPADLEEKGPHLLHAMLRFLVKRPVTIHGSCPSPTFLKGEDAQIGCIRKCKNRLAELSAKSRNREQVAMATVHWKWIGRRRIPLVTMRAKVQDCWPVRSPRSCSPSSLEFCFLTIMDATRPAGPVVAVSNLVSR